MIMRAFTYAFDLELREIERRSHWLDDPSSFKEEIVLDIIQLLEPYRIKEGEPVPEIIAVSNIDYTHFAWPVILKHHGNFSYFNRIERWSIEIMFYNKKDNFSGLFLWDDRDFSDCISTSIEILWGYLYVYCNYDKSGRK
jgi:hypothetical protein